MTNNPGRFGRSGWWRPLALAGAVGLSACAGGPPTAGPAAGKAPIVLQSTGAFEVGGKMIRNPANPSQTLSCDHGYVESFVPANARQVGLLFWHSSSTKVWEHRWDGGDGYKTLFLRERYPVHLWDGPRVGRANWSCEPINYKPDYFDQRNFFAWRFGPAFPNFHPGVQFPAADKEAWNQATRARYDEFDTLANALLQAEAGGQAIDRLGPVVAVTNSAGGWRAMLSALKAGSSNMKGIVAYETPGYVFPEGEGPPPAPNAPFGPYSVPLEQFRKLTRFPMQMVFGDNTAGHPTWEPAMRNARTFCSIVNRHGGDCEVLALPDAGLRGNTHIPFADMNNEAVARELARWLQRKGLDR